MVQGSKDILRPLQEEIFFLIFRIKSDTRIIRIIFQICICPYIDVKNPEILLRQLVKNRQVYRIVRNRVLIPCRKHLLRDLQNLPVLLVRSGRKTVLSQHFQLRGPLSIIHTQPSGQQ